MLVAAGYFNYRESKMLKYSLIAFTLVLSSLIGITAAVRTCDAERSRSTPVDRADRDWDEAIKSAAQLTSRKSYSLAIEKLQHVVDFAPKDGPQFAHAVIRIKEVAAMRARAFSTEAAGGDSCRNKLDWDAAIAHYQAALGLYLNDLSSKEVKDVKRRLAEVLEARDKMADYNVAMAHARKHLAAQEFLQALESGKRAQEVIPFSAEAEALLREVKRVREMALAELEEQIRSHLATKNYSAAVSAAKRGLAFDPGNDQFAVLARDSESALGNESLAKGEIALRTGSFADAEHYFELAARCMPDNSVIARQLEAARLEDMLERAKSDLKAGDYLSAFEKAQRLRSKYPQDDRPGRLAEEAKVAIDNDEVRRFESEFKHLVAIHVTVDGRRITMLDAGGAVREWDRDNGSELCSRLPAVRAAFGLRLAALSYCGSRLAIVSRTGMLAFGSTDGQTTFQRYSTNSSEWHRCKWSGDSSRIALMSRDGKIAMMDTKSNQIVYERTLTERASVATAVALSRDGRKCAVGFEDGQILIVLEKSDGRTAVFPLTRGNQSIGGAVTDMSFSADGASLASGTSTGFVRCWNVATRQENVANLDKRHSAATTTTCYSEDGRWFASGSDDATVVVWSLGAIKPVKSLPRQPAPIVALAFATLRKELVTADQRGTVKVWRLSTEM